MRTTTAVDALACRECGTRVPVAATHACPACFGPLEVVYDHEAIAARTSRASIEAGPRSLWRYADLLPELEPGAPRVDLGAGLTPLARAPRLGAAIGLDDLWLKDDTVNPTGSFKDRVVSVALTAARSLGFRTAACASTGNLAGSVAAHAAAAGMAATVLIPSDLEIAKVLAAAVYGPRLIAVDGTYDDVNRLCAQAADDLDWAFVNVNVRPFYAEGSKTLGYEIAEQLGWSLPDRVVAPMASGSMLVKIDKAFTELVGLGLVEGRPWRMTGAQASGCSPISTAYREGSREVRPVRPSTVAKSLAIGNPADGSYALDAVARTGGCVGDVDDAAIVEGIRLLARTEGLFGETAAGVTVAVLADLVRRGVVERGERTVAVISGVGHKTVDALAGSVGPAATIPPRLGALTAAIEQEPAT